MIKYIDTTISDLKDFNYNYNLSIVIPLYNESDQHHQWDLKVTDQLTPCVCSLPIHTEMDEVQLKYITEGVQSFFN